MIQNSDPQNLITLIFSGNLKPLQFWDKKVRDGHVKCVTDKETRQPVLEILGSKIAQTYITSPIDVTGSLGIRHPILNLAVKNMFKFFAFEVQVIDDKNCRRRFHVSTFITASEIKPFICKIPLILEEGWNQVQVNLQDLVRRAYGTNYKETIRVQIHPNCRVRRVYFTDELIDDEDVAPNMEVTASKRYEDDIKMKINKLKF